MKSTNQPQKCKWPGRTGHYIQIATSHFMTAWSAFARRFGAVIRWLAMYASPGITAYDSKSLPPCTDCNVEAVPYMPTHRVSGAEIAGAVAVCSMCDLKENGFRINGFPQISVFRAGCGATEFEIVLNFDSARVSFNVPALDAIRAGQRFKKGLPLSETFFYLVQVAIAKLESMPCK